MGSQLSLAQASFGSPNPHHAQSPWPELSLTSEHDRRDSKHQQHSDDLAADQQPRTERVVSLGPMSVNIRSGSVRWTTQLEDITPQVGLTGVTGSLLAFADMNNDGFVDLFMASAEHDLEVQAWTWTGDTLSGVFERSLPAWPLPGLTGLIPGDFSGSGTLDFIASVEHADCADVGAHVLMACNSSSSSGCASPVDWSPLPVAASSQPLAVDLTGSQQIDLFGSSRGYDDQPQCTAKLGDACTPGATSAKDCCSCGLACGDAKGGTSSDGKASSCQLPPHDVPTGWINQWDGANFSTVDPFAINDGGPPPSPPPPPLEIRYATPNSNAVVDLNGDCRADLMVVALPYGAPVQPTAPAKLTGCADLECSLLIFYQDVSAAAEVHSDGSGEEEGGEAREEGSKGRAAPNPRRKKTNRRDAEPRPRWGSAPAVNLTLPKGASQIAINDLDADGLLDLVFLAGGKQGGGGNLTLNIWCVRGHFARWEGGRSRRCGSARRGEARLTRHLDLSQVLHAVSTFLIWQVLHAAVSGPEVQRELAHGLPPAQALVRALRRRSERSAPILPALVRPAAWVGPQRRRRRDFLRRGPPRPPSHPLGRRLLLRRLSSHTDASARPLAAQGPIPHRVQGRPPLPLTAPERRLVALLQSQLARARIGRPGQRRRPAAADAAAAGRPRSRLT